MSKSITVRDISISALKHYYPDYKKIPFILPDLLILSVEFLCEIDQEFYKNGQLKYQFPVVNWKLHGENKWWYENGQLRYQYSYVNGKSHGEDKEWYDNGQLWYQNTYVNDKKHGEYEEYGENGNLVYKETYNEGLKID